MANVPQKTLSWLYEVLKREYRDPNRTYSDLAQLLSRYPSLAPRTDVYTFENGIPALLVHITGVIPVGFRGTTYRFPIALWVPHQYPYEAPMMYVTATDDMIVRPGQHVAGDGRVYHPYLAHWRDAWERSNVVDFMAILSDVFAKEPPVMSKQQAGPRPPQQQPPPRPPLPYQIQPPSSQPPNLDQRTRQSGPPPPPPKQQPGTDNRSSSPGQQRPGRYDAPPPLPPPPEHTRTPSGQRPYSQMNVESQRHSNGLQYAPNRQTSLRQSLPPQGYPPQQFPRGQVQQPPLPPAQPNPPNQPIAPLPRHQQPPSFSPTSQQQPQPQHYNQQYSPNYPPQQQGQPHQPPLHPQTQVLQSIQPPNQPQPQPQPKKPPPPDLLDSPFDIPLPSTTTKTPHSAPPIPRNPEKDALLSHISHQLTSLLHAQINQNTSALPALQSQYTALTTTLSTLQAEIPPLTQLQSTIQSNISLLQSSLSSADQAISSASQRAKRGDIPKVDEMLVAPTVVGKQLYDNVCEERGIEAGIWALQDGFVRGRVGSEVWARRTRELAREGFRRRWVVRKVGRGLGLDGA